MKTRTDNYISRILLILITVCSASCMTAPTEDRPLTQAELKALFSRSKNPRSLYLTVFEGPVGPEFENAQRLHFAQHSTLKLEDDDQPASIKLSASSTTLYSALIDPSSPESWASVAMKSQLPLTVLGPPFYHVEAAHLRDADSGFVAHTSNLKIDTIHVDSALFSIRNNVGDLGPFARGLEPVPDLVLGHQILRAFRFVQFNYPKQKMSLSSSDDFPKPTTGLLAKLPLQLIDGALGTEATLNGKRQNVLLDLAGSYELSLASEEKSMHLFLDDLALRHLELKSAEDLGLIDSPYPRIGWQALSEFIVTLDYHRQLIWIERPQKK